MRTIDDFAVAGQRVLVRDDLNVPLDGTRITDDGRIRGALPTLTALLDHGAEVIICAHLGRPAGKADPKYSLAPVAARLGELLGRPVKLAADVTGPSAQAAVSALRPGGLVMLENLRFDARETSKDDTQRGLFADELAALDDHARAHAFQFAPLVFESLSEPARCRARAKAWRVLHPLPAPTVPEQGKDQL